ncbi:hypothetical protein BCR32DRAFT_271462 [Anaeromyces robustus]|uniref:Non-homologous end-joining factor 1 n=1 Tax=Anaeromyces robustus TaxID=1754192 RepID=A0A1Y1WSN9_9FUNG|nr:hypothetical protein BCR32DRAFT_271462 [Anaeromyces robustus]|eukprot:ORX76154.1 hypothetical protein BCR32DRAFT_271462 [Anaeromyces robustus]
MNKNLIDIFHKLECIPWEYIELENNIKDTEIKNSNFNEQLISIKKENDTSTLHLENTKDNSKEDVKKKIIIENILSNVNTTKQKKKDLFQEKIKSIKTISNFSNSLNINNGSNNNNNNNNNNSSNGNGNLNLNLTILPLTSLTQNIPSSSFQDNNKLKHISTEYTTHNNNREDVTSSNVTINNNNKSFFSKTNYYIKYYFNADDSIYLFMITDMKNIWYEYIYNEEILNIKKKKDAVNFESQNNIIELIHNNIKSKEVNTTFRLINQSQNKDNICIQLSVPYIYVTFNWNFDCILLSNTTNLSFIKKENQDEPVAKLDGSKIFYEHITLPLILMISELQRRMDRYEEVITRKEKSIKILYDQLILLEETPPKRFKFEEFNKKIFDEELRFSTDIASSEHTVFTQENLVNLYKNVTNTVLSKTFPHLVNDEYKTELNNERLSLIPTLVSESNELNRKRPLNPSVSETIPGTLATINNNENSSSSSLSYNGLSDSTLKEDDNNQSILEGLEKEKDKEVINTLMKNKRNKIETIINKKKDKKKNKKRKLV